MWQYCINNNKDKELEEQMIAVECDIFYLSDILSIIFENYNLLSKLILLSCKDAINSFLENWSYSGVTLDVVNIFPS